MPLHYGSQKEEHHAVRQNAGVFDVSHMTDRRSQVSERVREFLRYLVANDVAKLKDYGKALYTCMLNPAGGVIDDLIIYFIGRYRVPTDRERGDARKGPGLDPGAGGAVRSQRSTSVRNWR